MTQGFHFISGMPRSGSTMLSAILRQNPRFSAGVSSPMASLVTGLLPLMNPAGEFQVFFDNPARERILRGVLEGFYATHAGQVIFDTNRTWAQKMPVLATAFPNAKFVFCVRSLVQVLQSFESLYFKNPLQLSSIIGRDPNTTVFNRVDSLMAPAGMIGASINGMKEAFYGPFSERIILLPYEKMVADPRGAIGAIYAFIGQEPFEHDFESIGFATPDYDALIGVPGLHNVRGKISVREQAETLPPEIVGRFNILPFWQSDPQGTRANLSLVNS